MSNKSNPTVATMGIDIGKNSFHVVGLDRRGAIVLRQKWSRGQIEARLAAMPPCLIGMEACVGAHHLSRKLQAHGHDARLMPAKYVRAYSKGQKNDFRDGGRADQLGWRALESVSRLDQGLQSFRSMRRMEASFKNARALRLRFSQSLARRRQRLSHAMVRSTIQRLGNRTNPLA